MLTLNRIRSLPRSITTVSRSIATRRTPWVKRSPTRNPRGGMPLRLRIATAPCAPVIIPETLISSTASRLENHCNAGLSTATAAPSRSAGGALDWTGVSSSDDQTNTPANVASNAADCTHCAGDKRKVCAKTKPPCCPVRQSTGQLSVCSPRRRSVAR